MRSRWLNRTVRRPRRRAPGGDRGESLIELLITVVIIGITVPALMGAVLLTVAASSQDRRQVQAQALVSSWAETVARENKTDAAYTSCPALSYYAQAPFAPGAIPTGFTATVVSISYWNAASSQFNATCAADPGIRLVQLKVSVPAGIYPAFDVSQSIVVRKLCLAC